MRSTDVKLRFLKDQARFADMDERDARGGAACAGAVRGCTSVIPRAASAVPEEAYARWVGGARGSEEEPFSDRIRYPRVRPRSRGEAPFWRKIA